MVLLSMLACNGADGSASCPSGYVWNEGAQQCFSKDEDGDGWSDIYDCDDDNAAVHPGAGEVCDGVDNDCNGLTDDEDGNVLGDTTYYADQDQDGHGGSALSVKACEKPQGYTATATDCEDVDPRTYPGAPELCDDLDNDCDGEVDEGDACASFGDFYGDITITSPAGAASFCENYGGNVYGTVTLSGYGLEDLSEVGCIEAIYGSLVIDLRVATEVSMPNLALVDGDIEVTLYEQTTSVSFTSLAEAGVITLSYGEALETLDLPALVSARGLIVEDMPVLETLSLPSVTSLGLFYSQYNESLSTIELPVLDSLEDLSLYYNPALTGLDLSSATTLGDLAIQSNYELVSLDLSGATSVGEVYLSNNDSIQSLDLDAATELGGLVLYSNDGLQTVTWAGIDSVEGDVIFYDNDALTLPDHSNIVQVDGDWGLWYSNTSTLDDLGSLEALLGDLYLVNNGLTSVDLSLLTVLGGLYLYNEDLSAFDLSGLDAPLTGNFYVAYNYDLDDFGWPEFDALDGDFVWTYNGPTDAIEADGLTSVGGSLRVSDASWGIIEDLDFGDLQSVGGEVRLDYLGSVETVDLARLEEVGGSFRIYYSDYIETVDVGSLVSVGGDFYLYDVGYYAEDFDLDVSLLEEVSGTVYLSYLSYYGDGKDIDLDFDSLDTLGGSFNVYYVNGYYGGDVTIGAPLLTSMNGGLNIRYNGRSYSSSNSPGDVDIDFSALETLGNNVAIYYNGYGSNIGNGASSGDVSVDLSSLRSANGTLEFSYNGYCSSGSSSWRCYAGTVDFSAPALETLGNSNAYFNYNGYAEYGEAGDVSVDMSSLTSISGRLDLNYNGYSYLYKCYETAYGGNVELLFTDLETVGSDFNMSYTGYAYNPCHGHNSYSDPGTVEMDFSSLREVYYLYFYRTGVRDFDGWGSLETVTSNMYIRYNYRLHDISGLEGGDTVTYMNITYNYDLGDSEAWDVYYSWSSVGSYDIYSN